MPRMDGTDPMRLGAKSSLKYGACDGYAALHRGMRCSRGFGRGMGVCRAISAGTKDGLLRRKAVLFNALTAVEKQLEKI